MSSAHRIPSPNDKLADDLFRVGAVKFGAFSLKAHRANPSLPLSPYYFDCRAVGHPKKPGPVPAALVTRIAMAMECLVADAGVKKIDCLAAVPHGAIPYAGHLALFLDGDPPTVRLAKRENDDGTTTVHDVDGDA